MEERSLSFDRCWEKHEQSVYYLCLRLLSRNTHDAQDAKTVTYLRANQHFDSCNGIDCEKKYWFLQIAKHICFDIYRKRQRETEVIEDFAQTHSSVAYPDLSADLNPEAHTLRLQNMSSLNNAINDLPKHLRDTIVSYAVHEKTYQHISQEMNISECNARKRVQIARKLLKTAIG